MWTDISAAADNVGKAVAKRFSFAINLFAQLVVANGHYKLVKAGLVMQALQVADAAYYLHTIDYCTSCPAIVDCILSTKIPQKERINSLFSAREFPYLKLELYC